MTHAAANASHTAREVQLCRQAYMHRPHLQLSPLGLASLAADVGLHVVVRLHLASKNGIHRFIMSPAHLRLTTCTNPYPEGLT